MNYKNDLYKDLELVKKYTNYIGFYFRKFKVKCESCVNKTEKEFLKYIRITSDERTRHILRQGFFNV